jgi:hypothetical protein
VIEYLVEENRVLKEQMQGKALRLNDDQRRRLGAKAKVLDRKTLDRIATFMAQVARNLTDASDGFLRDHRAPIFDRDSKFCSQVPPGSRSTCAVRT